MTIPTKIPTPRRHLDFDFFNVFLPAEAGGMPAPEAASGSRTTLLELSMINFRKN